jgi:uncharacterized delta-60 repeat protein
MKVQQKSNPRKNIWRLCHCLGTFLFMVWLPVSVQSAPGDLDLSFGNGGTVVTPITDAANLYDEPNSMRVQPDGKIVVCGQIIYSDDKSGYPVSFFLARYNPNGTLDASFGTNGKVVAPIGGSGGGVYVGHNIALQPDGKIIAVGYSWGVGASFAVFRYNPDGTLDGSFGTGGRVVAVAGIYGGAYDVAVQPDGKIVVIGGALGNGEDMNFAVVRYNPDGSLDDSFGTGGKVITPVSNGDVYDYADAVVLQPDGKIIVVGTIAVIGVSPYDFALVRYNVDGSLDSGFGTNGKIIHSVTNGHDLARDVALQPDGKIVVAGGDVLGPGGGAAIVRYNTNGSIDTSFATNGIFTTESGFFVGKGIAMQPNGKILAFGWGISGAFAGFAVARLNPDGSPDLGFGVNGRIITPIGTNDSSYARAGALQPDGKILAFGLTRMINSDDIALVRYLGDSAAPRPTKFDFDGDAKADISVFRSSDRIWYLNRSTQGVSATQFGLSTDKITPADFDGDGKTDISVYRDGIWYRLNSSDNSFNAAQFGIASDIPVPADFTGDGHAELAIYRNGVWWSLNLANNQVNTIQFGISTDKPVVSDYDGDGRADQAVYRNGEWHLNRSSQGYAVVNFGLATDKPTVGDYDGDGRADEAVYRDGTWYVLQSSQGYAEFRWGVASDIPAPADYDGDGKADAAVYRDGTWYLRQSANGIAIQQFGLATDNPVPAAFLP